MKTAEFLAGAVYHWDLRQTEGGNLYGAAMAFQAEAALSPFPWVNTFTKHQDRVDCGCEVRYCPGRVVGGAGGFDLLTGTMLLHPCTAHRVAAEKHLHQLEVQDRGEWQCGSTALREFAADERLYITAP